MVVTKKMFANYLGIHRNSVASYYQGYLDDLEIKRNYLLVSDIAKNDGLEISEVCEIMGVASPLSH